MPDIVRLKFLALIHAVVDDDVVFNARRAPAVGAILVVPQIADGDNVNKTVLMFDHQPWKRVTHFLRRSWLLRALGFLSDFAPFLPSFFFSI